jgi:hypothetical protein
VPESAGHTAVWPAPLFAEGAITMTTATAIDSSAATEAARRLERDLHGLLDAWQARDEARIRTYFSSRDDLKLWGTDLFERIVGRAEADREFGSWIATCPPWVSIESTHRVMDVRDGIAWVADDIEGKWVSGAERGVDHYRMTTIWEDENGSWRVVHANLASPR